MEVWEYGGLWEDGGMEYERMGNGSMRYRSMKEWKNGGMRYGSIEELGNIWRMGEWRYGYGKWENGGMGMENGRMEVWRTHDTWV